MFYVTNAEWYFRTLYDVIDGHFLFAVSHDTFFIVSHILGNILILYLRYYIKISIQT